MSKKILWRSISWSVVCCMGIGSTLINVALADKPEKGEAKKSEPKVAAPANRPERAPAPRVKAEAAPARSQAPPQRPQSSPRAEQRTEAPRQAAPNPAAPRTESRPPARIGNPQAGGAPAAPGINREAGRDNRSAPGTERPRVSERPKVELPTGRPQQVAPNLPAAGTTPRSERSAPDASRNQNPVTPPGLNGREIPRRLPGNPANVNPPADRGDRGINRPDRGEPRTAQPANPQQSVPPQIPGQSTPLIPPRIGNPLGGTPAGGEAGGDRRNRERGQTPGADGQPIERNSERNTPGDRTRPGDGSPLNRPNVVPGLNPNSPNPAAPNLGGGRGPRSGNTSEEGAGNPDSTPVRPRPGLDRRPSAPTTPGTPESIDKPGAPESADKPKDSNSIGRDKRPMPDREERPGRPPGKIDGPDRSTDPENRDQIRGGRPEGTPPGIQIPGRNLPGRDNDPARPGRNNMDDRREEAQPANEPSGDRLPGMKNDSTRNRDRVSNGETRINRDNRPAFSTMPVKPAKARTEEIERQLQDLNRNVQKLATDPREVSRALDRGNVIPVRIGADGRLDRDNGSFDLSRIQSREQLRELNSSRDLARFFGRNDDREWQSLRIDRVSGRFQDRLVDSRWDNSFRNYSFYNRFNVGRQFELYRRGDVARQLQFNSLLVERGGWRNRYYGPIAPAYSRVSFSGWYAGPRLYPRYTWFPFWSPWVRWSWWNTVPVVYDPRPGFVRPVYCEPAPLWTTVWQYPQYQALPMVASGTWVDVEPAAVVNNSVDIQLLAVRFVDSGHTEQQLGPRYRVWLRNNATASISQPFNVVLMAANDAVPDASLPQSGVTIGTMEPGQITSVDIRLPMEANQLFVNSEGRKEPFQRLHLIADTERVLNDLNPENNVAVVDRGEILSVDPAAFSLDTTAASPGTMVSVAGEGLGPEPGRVVLTINGQEIDPEIYGWYDLGVQFKVPETLILNGVNGAQVIIIRGDGAVTNPLDLQLVPVQNLGPAIGWNEQAEF